MKHIKLFEQFINERSLLDFKFSKGDVFTLDDFTSPKPSETASKFSNWDLTSKVKPHWHEYPEILYDHSSVTIKVLDFKPLDRRKDVGTKQHLKRLKLPGEYTCYIRKIEIIKPSKINLTIKAIGAITTPETQRGESNFVYGIFTGNVHRNLLDRFLERSSDFKV